MNRIFFLLLSFLFIQTYAIEKNPCKLTQDVCCEKANDTFAFSYPTDTGLVCPKKFNVSGSFLWMSFYEEGLEYAIRENQGVSQKDKLDFKPGFRVHCGYENFFLIDIEWTYIRIKDEKFSAPGNNDLYGAFYPPNAGFLNGASSRISGDFNTLDLNISKRYLVSRYYISNPKLGIQAAWIDQDYLVRYFIMNLKQSIFCKNDFWGIGLKAGYNSEFLIGKNFSVYGDIESALLFSKFDISQIAHNITIYNYSLEESFYKIVPNAKIGLGFTWARMLNKNRVKAKLKVGYEFQQWWSINQLRRPMDVDPTAFKVVSRNDLTFNGLVATIHLDL